MREVGLESFGSGRARDRGQRNAPPTHITVFRALREQSFVHEELGLVKLLQGSQ